MKTVRLASPQRVAMAMVPVIGFLITPFLPFAQEPTLWFGWPAVLVWTAFLVLLTVATLHVIEQTYLRSGGAQNDRIEEEEGVVPE
jgi:hypothetical protein